jgi:hypothetical protein
MDITGTHLTVAQFCEGLESGTIVINHEYQRQPGVWPAEARSFLIETILLGFPVPKLTLHLVTERSTRRTTSEIVDGQQRAMAVKDFANDGFRLSRNIAIEDARAQTYSALPPELQQRFLSYPLGIDQLVNVTSEDIREIFRRINSYEVPLNPEEQRHAKHQGPFKWFIYRLAKDYSNKMNEMGTFTERQLIRMADMKLLAEISHALIYGVSTTSKRSLDKLYDSRDVDFEEENVLEGLIRGALDFVEQLEELHGTDLMKHFSLYSLILAVIHAREGLNELRELGKGGTGLVDRTSAVTSLSKLLRALDDQEKPHPRYSRFCRAFEKGTNVGGQRLARAEFFLKAISRK